MTAPIFIQPTGFGFAGLSASPEEEVMLQTVAAAKVVQTRRIAGVAATLGGLAIAASGFMSRSGAKWPMAALGVLTAGAGGFLLANVQSEKVFFWESPVS